MLGVVQCCILRVMCVACVNCKQPGGGGQRRLGDTGERPQARPANTSTAYFISTAVLLLLAGDGRSSASLIVGTAGCQGVSAIIGVHSPKFIDLSSVKCSESC